MTQVMEDQPAADAEAEPVRVRRLNPVTAAIALVVALLGFLPIANWLPGGHAASWYRISLDVWASGTTIVLGIGVVVAILSRRVTPLWRPGFFAGLISLWSRRPILVTLAVATAALIAYLLVALLVLGGRPLLIDEIVEVFHAQILAGGALSRPAFAYPEF